MLSLLNDEHKYTRHSYGVVLTLFVNEMFCHSYSEYLYIFDMINSYSCANGCISSNPQDDTYFPLVLISAIKWGSSLKVIFPFCMFFFLTIVLLLLIQTKLHISATVFCVPHVWEHYYWTLTRTKAVYHSVMVLYQVQHIAYWESHYITIKIVIIPRQAY